MNSDHIYVCRTRMRPAPTRTRTTNMSLAHPFSGSIAEVAVEPSNATWLAFDRTENAVPDPPQWPNKYNRTRLLATLAAFESATAECAAAPPDATRTAIHLLDELATAFEWPVEWVDPHVTRSPDGDVVLEWWHADRKLTVYVSADAVEHVRAWGSDMVSQMDEGRLTDLAELGHLVRWLTGRT
jgi:hypothetical protein